MSEDCLYLNIFAPFDSSNNVKKVMFWIHGGGYTAGDAKSYLPTDLVADHDVIVVTIQYRLGVFEFLSSGDGALPGNGGLRDQILALNWVKDNIGRFNGDADDITIFGESAGGGSVSFLTLSPLTKGLFTKAIIQSGVVLSPWSLMSKARAENSFKFYAEKAGCQPWAYFPYYKESYHQTIVDCLRDKDPNNFSLIGAQPGVDVTVPNAFANVIEFAPVVDGDVVPREPWSMLNDKAYLTRVGALDRKYLIGTTNKEGLLYLSVLQLGKPGLTLDETVAYLTDPPVFEALMESELKEAFPYGMSTVAQDLIRFQYSFPKDQGNRAPLQLRGNNTQLIGSNHATDLAYLFDQDDASWDSYLFYQDIYSPYSAPMFDVLRSSFSSFAKNGNPSWRGLPTAWPRYDGTTQSYVALDVQPEVRQRVYGKRVALWRDYLTQLSPRD